MKRTSEAIGIPRCVRRFQLSSSMQTKVVEGTNFHVRRTNNQNRAIPDVVDMKVTLVRNMFLATRPLPCS